jgi:hypothetical protein
MWKKLLVAATPVFFFVILARFVWLRSHLFQEFVAAFLPSIGLVIYIVLDHLWTEHPHEGLWHRLSLSLAYWNWKWKGATLDSRKSQLAAGLVALTLISGSAQLLKAHEDTADAAFVRNQLTNANARLETANSVASKSLIAATNSDNDLRILQANLISKMEGDRQVLLAIATNCPSSPLLPVAVEQIRRPLVVAQASSNIQVWATWAEDIMKLADLQKIENARVAEASKQNRIDSFKQDYDIFTSSIQLLLDTLIAHVARKGDAVTSTPTRLPSVESIIDANYHCHMMTILVGTPPLLAYNCDIDRNGDDPPVLRLSSDLSNETVAINIERWGSGGRVSFFCSGYSQLNEVSLAEFQGTIQTNIQTLIGYTAKKSGYPVEPR